MSIITFTTQPNNLDSTQSFFAYDPYIERFWQPFLGPSATGLLNLLSMHAQVSDHTFSFTREELSLRIGTGHRDGTSSPVMKQLSRLSQFQLIHKCGNDTFAVSTHLPQLSQQYVRRLSQHDRMYHELWVQQLVENPLRTQRRRAQHLSMIMTMMGYHNSVIEHSLARSGLHPSIVGEVLSTFSTSFVA